MLKGATTFRLVDTAVVAADPALVERFLLDPGCLRRWNPIPERNYQVSTAVLQLGTSIESTVRVGPLRFSFVNIVSDHAELEKDALQVAREIMGKSPQAQRMLKFAFNLLDDGLMGQQVFAGETTRLAYMTDEAVEGRDQFLEKREPDWSPYPWYY